MDNRSGFNPAWKAAGKAVFDADGKPKPMIHNAVNRAIEVQRPLILANLKRLRRRNPAATASQLSAMLERDYLTAVTTAGGAAGAAAAFPGIGTIASLGLSAGATVAFLEATALYAQSIAELHGVHTDDPERARTLVMAILLDDEGLALVRALAGQAEGRDDGPMKYWGNALGAAAPTGVIRGIGTRIRRRFIRKFVTQQGAAMFGRAIPFGIGAAVGGAGNNMMGRRVIEATRQAFGPPPDVIPGQLARELAGELESAPARD